VDRVMAIKRVKRIRRKRRKTKPYFGIAVHEAIIRYQDSEEQDSKHEIYVSEILPAFSKLVENLIFIHGFLRTAGPYDELKNDCVTFLYETLHKFDHTRGTKAFSYFNVVAKNWLIIKSKQNIKKNRRNISIELKDYMSSEDKFAIESYSIVNAPDINIIKSESMVDMFLLMDEIRTKLTVENEIACMDAIITLFRHVDDLDMLNKRAVFVYIRDISGLNPKQLSIAMSAIRKHYKGLKIQGKFDIFF
jgi:hypothetical protein